MTTPKRIQQAALTHFAASGYEGASLTRIAADVGIKKPSIYAHFASKDDLFLNLLEMAINDELVYAHGALRGGSPELLREQLFDYLKNIRPRFETSPQMRFWLNVRLLPPAHLLGHPSMEGLHKYMDDLEAAIYAAFLGSSYVDKPGIANASQLTAAYLGLADSLQAELIYRGPQKFERRLQALWSLFDQALSAHK